MNLRTIVASAAAGALAVGSTAATAQTERSTAPASHESAMSSEAAPWPLLVVGIAALAALIYLLVDDDEDSVSA